MMRRRVPAPALLAAAMAAASPATAPQPATAQDTTFAAGWNDPRVMELVARARERRQEPLADTLLRSYRADATGHIYFFLDREDAGEPVLLRADQVALELYWAQPGRTKQIIRGMRSEEQFPIRNFAYYLDRYTVIQNGFGDEIRVGEGRDVADVPHPLAPGADALYDYRLADSLTIRIPGRADPLRVYEVQVRPDDFGLPAIVGSLFLERTRGDLVRLAFTFTPSAYLDPRNERVEVVLEHALWEDRYWLPREQRLLVRREIPEIDLDVGTVIRAVLRVDDLTLNVDLPRGFFRGLPVVAAAGPEGLAAYEFEEGLYAGLDDIGVGPGAAAGTLDEVDVERIAGRILRERFLRGIPRLRFYAPNASAIARYGRQEGLFTGAGVAYGVGEHQLTAYGGWAWSARRPTFEIAARPFAAASGGWFGEGHYQRAVDLGARPGAGGVVSSAAAAVLGDDFRDLYHETGFALGRLLPIPGGAVEVALTGQIHTSAPRVLVEPHLVDAAFRPTFAIDEGRQLAVSARARFTAPRNDVRLSLETGWFDAIDGNEPDGADHDGWFAVVRQEWTRAWRGHRLRWGVDARQTALVTLDAPLQHGVLVGGRNTLAGHDFRGWHAPQALLADAEVWFDLVPRWLRLRGLAAIAGMRARPAFEPADPLFDPGFPTLPPYEDRFLWSVGAGIATIDGLIRLDAAVGFGLPEDWPPGAPGTEPVLILSTDPRLWGFL